MRLQLSPVEVFAALVPGAGGQVDSTPAGNGLSWAAIASTSSARFGITWNSFGSGLPGQVLRVLGMLLALDLERLLLRDEATAP